MKSLTQFVTLVLAECGYLCGGIDTSRDAQRITDRVESEGESFLTITLPLFAKDLEKAISRERVIPDDFAGYRRVGELPVFLGGFLDQIFDRGTGLLIDSDAAHELAGVPTGISVWRDVRDAARAIQSIRQVCLMTAKIKRDCTPDRVEAAFAAYMNCEKELRVSDAEWSGSAIADSFREDLAVALLRIVHFA